MAYWGEGRGTISWSVWVELAEEGGKWWEIKSIFRDLLSLKNPLHPNIYSYTQQAVGNMSPELRTQDGAAGKEMGMPWLA